MLAACRRPHRLWLTVAFVAAGAAVVVLATAAHGPVQRLSASGAVGAETPPPSRPSARASAPRPADPPIPFARWRGIELDLPGPRVLCVCYHEASYRDALPLHPLGRRLRDGNRTKFPPGARVTDGPGYVIMASRGRPTPVTSAVDLVIRAGQAFRSPVSGVVTKVKPYRLYGKYPDVKVTIRPDEDRRYQVVMIHLARVRVRPGGRVVAGVTPIGVPRAFPFSSQTDSYLPGRHPHVHLEIVDPRRPR